MSFDIFEHKVALVTLGQQNLENHEVLGNVLVILRMFLLCVMILFW